MHLLIDGKNVLYRALFATAKDQDFGYGKKSRFVAISRFMHDYWNRNRTSKVHVFWDAPRTTTWRRLISPVYKDGRTSQDEIKDDITKYQEICMSVWQAMGMRQYYRDFMEADDLVYAFCRHVRATSDEEIVIVSNDSDLRQIPYTLKNVQIFNPSKKAIAPLDEVSPVEQKSLKGDTSDNIAGYAGIGEVKSKKLIQDNNALLEFFNKNGSEIYRRNLLLIDLSLCPYLIDNVLYVMGVMNSECAFDAAEVKRLLHEKYKMKGIVTEYTRTILPFAWSQGDKE